MSNLKAMKKLVLLFLGVVSIEFVIAQDPNVSDAPKPLYVINNTSLEQGFLNVDKLNPEDISSIAVLKEKSATEAYGKAGENGVVIITMKTPNVDAPPAKIGPLYVIDDIVRTGLLDLSKIDPDHIQSVSVLKEKTALDEYGKAGKNGVVIINMKNP